MTYQEILALTEANSKAIDKLSKTTEANSKAIVELTKTTEANSKAIDKLSKTTEANSKAIDKLSKNIDANRKAIVELTKSSHAAQARWDKWMEKYGGYVDNSSRKTENFLIEALWQQDLVVGDVAFDDLFPNSQRRKKKVVAIELDALLINGTTVGILEVKSTLHVNDIERIRDKLIRRFRDYYPEYRDKELAVLVAGELINPDADELAHELGYIIIKPNNQGISVDASCYRAV